MEGRLLDTGSAVRRSLRCAGRPGSRTPLGSKGFICSAPAFACYTSFISTRLAANVANHLREKPASKGPNALGLGWTGVVLDNVMSRQSPYFGTAVENLWKFLCLFLDGLA